MYCRDIKIKSLGGSVDAMGDIINRFIKSHKEVTCFSIDGIVPTSQNTVIIVLAYTEKQNKYEKISGEEYEI